MGTAISCTDVARWLASWYSSWFTYTLEEG